MLIASSATSNDADRARIISAGLSRSLRTPAAVHLQVMRFLLVHAFFDVSETGDWSSSAIEELRLGPAKPALSVELRQLCATRLMGLLADVLAGSQALVKQPGAQDAPAALAVANDAAARKQRAVECAAGLDALIELCSKLERARTAVTLVLPLDAEASAVRKSVRSLLAPLDRVAAEGAGGQRSAASTQSDAARVLLRVLLLLQLSAPQDFSADMQDLPRCLGAALAASGVPVADGEADDDAPHHMDVLVEILLSLLAKPSAILRDVVERMFRAFASAVTPEGVRSMLRIIARSKGRRHSKTNEDSDEDVSDGEDDASDDDEEEVEEEGDDGDDDEPEHMQKSLPRSADSSGEDSDDGAGMDDEAMFRTDAALAAVLALSKEAKSQKKTAVEALVHFKFRVLSLLELYIKAQQTSPALPVRCAAQHAAHISTDARLCVCAGHGRAAAAVARVRDAGCCIQRRACRAHFRAARQERLQGSERQVRGCGRRASGLVCEVHALRVSRHCGQGDKAGRGSMSVPAPRARCRRARGRFCGACARTRRSGRLLCLQEVPAAIQLLGAPCRAFPGSFGCALVRVASLVVPQA